MSSRHRMAAPLASEDDDDDDVLGAGDGEPGVVSTLLDNIPLLDLPVSESIKRGYQQAVKTRYDGTITSQDGDEDYYHNALDVPPRPQRDMMVFPAALSILLLVFLLIIDGFLKGLTFVIAICIGATLVYSGFGFSSFFRRIFTDVRTGGVRLQLVMLLTSTLLFSLVLGLSPSALPDADPTLVGPRPKLGRPGVSVVLGAFMFGIGQQIADGCGSGILVGAARGRLRSMNALLWFIVGTTWSASDWGWWMSLPNSEGYTLSWAWGYLPALLFQVALLALLVFVSVSYENWYHGDRLLGLGFVSMPAQLRDRLRMFEPNPPSHDDSDIIGYRRSRMQRLVFGPWPKLSGAIALAVLNALLLLVAGHPWGVTTAYSQWGSKVAMAMGATPDEWPYWHQEELAGVLFESPLRNSASIVNFGVFLGAVIAAMATGTFVQDKSEYYQCGNHRGVNGFRVFFGATLGGLLMGYGSRIAFGCNIGAFFSGMSSTSIHSYVWILSNLPGQYLGVALRPLFHLRNEDALFR